MPSHSLYVYGKDDVFGHGVTKPGGGEREERGGGGRCMHACVCVCASVCASKVEKEVGELYIRTREKCAHVYMCVKN